MGFTVTANVLCSNSSKEDVNSERESFRLLTWNPPVMDSLNQIGFFSLMFLLRYQFFMGMLDSLG